MTRLGELSDRLRERSVRVFDYLADLSRLRTKTIRNIDQYQDVFWFDSLPSDKDCHTIAWGNEDDDQKSAHNPYDLDYRPKRSRRAIPLEVDALISRCADKIFDRFIQYRE